MGGDVGNGRVAGELFENVVAARQAARERSGIPLAVSADVGGDELAGGSVAAILVISVSID